MGHTAPPEAHRSAHTIAIEGLSFGFPGGPRLFQDFSLSLQPGITAILGHSGVGKTSLLRLISGRLRPSSGHVRDAMGRRIAWMAPDGGLLPWADAIDNVCLGANLRGEPADRAKASRLLDRLGLGEHTSKRPAEMSAGMQQRVALARTLLEDADIILLDEPFTHLDARTKAQLYTLVTDALSGRTVVAVTHDPYEALALADRVIVVCHAPAAIAADETLEGPTPRDPRDPALTPCVDRIMTALGVR